MQNSQARALSDCGSALILPHPPPSSSPPPLLPLDASLEHEAADVLDRLQVQSQSRCSLACSVGSGGKRARPCTDENTRPPSPFPKRPPHSSSSHVSSAAAATPTATSSRAAATPARGDVLSFKKQQSTDTAVRTPSAAAARTSLSSRKRPSTPINSVEMNVLSRRRAAAVHGLLPPTPHTSSSYLPQRAPTFLFVLCIIVTSY